jgi:hypothetical protein
MQQKEFTGRLMFYHNVERPYVCKLYRVSSSEKITPTTVEGERVYIDSIVDPVVKTILESHSKILTTLANII